MNLDLRVGAALINPASIPPSSIKCHAAECMRLNRIAVQEIVSSTGCRMSLVGIDSEIEELSRLRKQNSYWRTGATVVLAVVALWAVFTLNSSARGLAQAGPTQDKFVKTLNEGLQKHTLPAVEAVARTTFAQMQPTISREFTKLNKRVPELTKATLTELDTLQKDLPEQGSKVLDDQFSGTLTKREDKIKTMFPQETQEQMTTFVQNLQKQGHDQILAVNTELLAPHRAKIQSIMASMQAIKKAEAANVHNVDPNWEMGLSLLDVMKDDLASLRPDKAGQKVQTTQATADKGKVEAKK